MKVAQVLQHPLLAAMLELYHSQISENTLFALPVSLVLNSRLNGNVCQYSETEQVVVSWKPSAIESTSWIRISQGASIDQLDEARVESLLSHTQASVVCLGVDEQLTGHREQIRYTRDGRIVGFRRHYEDSALAVPPFEDWPHRVYIRSACVDQFASLPSRFEVFGELCRANGLEVQSYAVAGSFYDLNTSRGQLGLVRYIDGNDQYVRAIERAVPGYQCLAQGKAGSRCGPRVIGRAWVSSTSKVSPCAVLISPVVISDQAHVESKVIIESSIIKTNAHVKKKTIVSHRVLDEGQDAHPQGAPGKVLWDSQPQKSRFRHWSSWAYINTLKRSIDVVSALAVIVLFLPIFPAIALAIKINSPGSIFYKARRQGLHGKEFNCLKFRTMKVGADQLQDKLRAINDVDGPQFKMVDDPRISAVGRFLRETYLDEIPQFINVLKGEMSVVGPRPSPKEENTQCPRWRDARLSVRPGITGLWQLLRTREPLRDFQEWIHYDIDYVKRVSARLDMWICWRTFLQMLGKFAEQF